MWEIERIFGRPSPLPWLVCGSALLLAACSDGTSTSGDLKHDVEPAEPEVCGCELKWEVDNLVPCWDEPTDSTPPSPYSSHLDDQGVATCEPYAGQFPHPTPAEPWGPQRFEASCTGSAQLCLILKQGEISAASDDDCVLATLCQDVDYTTADVPLELSPLPAWAGQDESCARDFYEHGGYYEMVANDYALGCKSGAETLLGRVPFCPVKCSMDPTLAECEKCGDGTATIEF